MNCIRKWVFTTENNEHPKKLNHSGNFPISEKITVQQFKW